MRDKESGNKRRERTARDGESGMRECETERHNEWSRDRKRQVEWEEETKGVRLCRKVIE